MATICPKCKKGTIKKMRNEQGIKCERYIPVQNERGEWTNKGQCNFHLSFKSKLFGDFTEDEIRDLLAGKEVVKGNGKIAKLDLQNPFFITDVNSELEDF